MYVSVITTNGQKSTVTTFTVVVKTATPPPQTNSPADQTQTATPQLQSLGVRTTSSTGIILLAINFSIGILWTYLW